MSAAALEPLDPALYRETVRRALAEDLGWGDATTDALIERGAKAQAVILARAPGVVAGIEVALEAFRQMDPGVWSDVRVPDGERCRPGGVIALLRGSAAGLLTAERTALNLLQRLSGIATLTRAFVDAARGAITVLDTRKTTPTLRVLEKYAVRAGGGRNHRASLDAAILIKDNHLRLAGGVTTALARAGAVQGEVPVEVEIEVQSLSELDEALAAGARAVLLDNMTTADIREAVRRCEGRATTEISGGVTLARMEELAATGATAVSIGALTHSAPALDMSLEIDPA
ncbi:MAG: carboxylating nicotinate-nucleotide diphosphorylase [Acidimicrobiia bacterium]|nr:carboxylating nicotinate-nucleotide diphosphorylase [Acidimicrobiia bacterium]